MTVHHGPHGPIVQADSAGCQHQPGILWKTWGHGAGIQFAGKFKSSNPQLLELLGLRFLCLAILCVYIYIFVYVNILGHYFHIYLYVYTYTSAIYIKNHVYIYIYIYVYIYIYIVLHGIVTNYVHVKVYIFLFWRWMPSAFICITPFFILTRLGTPIIPMSYGSFEAINEFLLNWFGSDWGCIPSFGRGWIQLVTSIGVFSEFGTPESHWVSIMFVIMLAILPQNPSETTPFWDWTIPNMGVSKNGDTADTLIHCNLNSFCRRCRFQLWLLVGFLLIFRQIFSVDSCRFLRSSGFTREGKTTPTWQIQINLGLRNQGPNTTPQCWPCFLPENELRNHIFGRTLVSKGVKQIHLGLVCKWSTQKFRRASSYFPLKFLWISVDVVDSTNYPIFSHIRIWSVFKILCRP